MHTQAAVLSLLAFDADAAQLTLDGDWAGERPWVAADLSLPLVDTACPPVGRVDDQASSLRRLRAAADADERASLRIAC